MNNLQLQSPILFKPKICTQSFKYIHNVKTQNNIIQEAHGPQHSLEKQFQSINTCAYDHTATLIKGEKRHLLFF